MSNFGKQWIDVKGKVQVRYGVHESRIPIVVLEAYEENGPRVVVALAFDEVSQLVQNMAQAAQLAQREVTAREQEEPS